MRGLSRTFVPSSTAPGERQAPSAVIVIRALTFMPNPATAADNAFQGDVPSGQSDEVTSNRALAEMDAMARALQEAGVRVHVFEDEGQHPMYASNRRHERRADVLEMLKSEYRCQTVVDYSGLEPDGIFLEGTRAMVLDHVSRVAYMAVSHRADTNLLERFCSDFNYEPMVFEAVDSEDVPVYHTNVIVCVGTEVALIALEMSPDEQRREQVCQRHEVHGAPSIGALEREKVACPLQLDQLGPWQPVHECAGRVAEEVEIVGAHDHRDWHDKRFQYHRQLPVAKVARDDLVRDPTTASPTTRC
jgi:hypothetical protein